MLSLRDVTKHFGAIAALDKVNLQVSAGEVHCLLGENGAGKSTLCNIIFGVHSADAGAMWLNGKSYSPEDPAEALASGVAMVHQHFSLIGRMTVAENLMLGQIRGRLRYAEFAERISEYGLTFGFKLNPLARVDQLSVSERQRLEIVKCLMRRPQVLLLDEPTAVLPPDAVDSFLGLCRNIANSGCGVILVTHKLGEIGRIGDRATVMRGGRITFQGRMQDTDLPALVRAMIGRDLAIYDAAAGATFGLGSEKLSITATTAHNDASPPRTPTPEQPAGQLALRIKDLTVDDQLGVTKLDAFHLSVRAGEIVGLAGVEGNGQDELVAVLSGLLRPQNGRICVGDHELGGASPEKIRRAGVGIIPADRHATGCIVQLNVAENLFLHDLGRFTRFGLVVRKKMNMEAIRLMHEFNVRAPGPTTPFSQLSGGNQQKAVLARELKLKPLRLLLAVQPTRGLDIAAVEAVYQQIQSCTDTGVGVLIIASDLDELIAVADRIVVLYRGRAAGEFPAAARYRQAIGAMMSGHH